MCSRSDFPPYDVVERRVIVERDGEGFVVMFADGSVRGFASRDAVLRAIKRLDAKSGADMTLTEVEWRS